MEKYTEKYPTYILVEKYTEKYPTYILVEKYPEKYPTPNIHFGGEVPWKVP